MGWIGVDLDGTLAHYYGWAATNGGEIGDPIPAMVDRVKGWLATGHEVRIFTSRVAGPEATEQRLRIKAWCVEHLGMALPVTCCKDMQLITLWDDRCVQVKPNTGEVVGGERL